MSLNLGRREFMHMMGVAAAAGMLPGCGSKMDATESAKRLYNLPMGNANVRIMHITDTHAQLKPVYFREPNVNLGMGPAYGKVPHIVGDSFLKHFGIKPNSIEAHAFTYINFTEEAQKYGKVGGFSHVKTLVDQLRESAGGRQNTLLMDGGDMWHGSGTALWTRGRDMVEASNVLGVDIMTGHWEFTYTEEEVLANLKAFKGEFLAQNVRVLADSMMSDSYADLTSKFDGMGMFDEDTGHAFKPYTIKDINGVKVAVIGQAFPRTANANPRANFPDWSFGLRTDDLQELVDSIRENEKPGLVIMISHNGMDVDIKMASQVSGIDAIFGGHTHDGMPAPVKVNNPGGTTLVTNAGSNGKYVGVMDFEVKAGKIQDVKYTLLPVFSNLLVADKDMENYINGMRQTVYDKNIVESRRPDAFYNQARLGRTYEDILSEELAVAGETLYRRGNFMGSWDQVIVNALREEHDTQISFSAGVRWGTSCVAGQAITMENVMDETSMTYGETYRDQIKGSDLKNILEGIAENLFVVDPYLQSGGDMVRIGGMDYTCDPTQPLGSRISEMRLDDGTVIDDKKTYTVAGWAQVEAVGSGRLMWDVTADYLRRNKSLELKKINHPNLKGVKGNPGIENYEGKLL
jgi:sulfur-oxidizing protein SoxB